MKDMKTNGSKGSFEHYLSSHSASTEPCPVHFADGIEQKVLLSVTVESSELPRVRAALKAAGDAVGVMTVTPVPKSAMVRLLLSAKASALDALQAAIARAVSAGGFARILRV